MRLLSATIRNCRIHRDITVEFDPARTCIVGPNESGKSTLLEAIHRALFLKAKGNTEHHRALIPFDGSTPEVKLVFETPAGTHTLHKRFGPGGTVSLQTPDDVLQGEEAEARLAEITQAAELTGRDGATRQWAHLWTWQGDSSGDPAAHANGAGAALLQRLHQHGGAGAALSDLDTTLAARIDERHRATFTDRGTPRADSELARARARAEEARAAAAAARERLARLATALADLEAAGNALCDAGPVIADLEQQRVEALRRKETLDAVRQTLKSSERDLADAERELQKARTAQEQADQLARDLLTTREALAPLEARATQLEAALASARDAFDASRGQAQKSADLERSARTLVELHKLHATLADERRRTRDLERKQRQLAESRKELKSLEETLARLPDITETKLNRARELETELVRARVARDALAVRIDVLAAEKPVRIGDATHKMGASVQLHTATEIAVGPTRLRITPGGTDISEAAHDVDSAETALRDHLAALGVATVAEGVAILDQRTSLAAEIRPRKRSLKELEDENVDGHLDKARREIVSTEAELERLRASHPGLPLDSADDEAAARAARRDAEAALRRAADDAETRRAAENAAKKRLAEAEQAHRVHVVDCEAARRAHAELDTRLKAHEEREGDAARRDLRLAEARRTRDMNATAKHAIEAQIAELGPDRIPADLKRLERALSAAVESRTAAIQRRAAAEALLRNDGASDPHAEAEFAEAEAARAQSLADAAQRQADALARLHRAFAEERARLAEAFTAPLIRRVQPYLADVLGPRVEVQVRHEDNTFGAIQVVRDGVPVPFPSLSGGTREQVAGAFRLAIAELLAPAHGGCLPVVFDDAFAWSDPARTQAVPAMLDRAAEAGLQVILLSCNPREVQGLGARMIELARPQPRPASAAAPTRAPAEEPEAAPRVVEEPAAPPRTRDAAAEPPPAPVAEDDARAFVDALAQQGGRAGNGTLRDVLGWEDARYDAVKQHLRDTGRIGLGRGRGGSVQLIGPPLS